jgi:hypothetical protein
MQSNSTSRIESQFQGKLDRKIEPRSTLQNKPSLTLIVIENGTKSIDSSQHFNQEGRDLQINN